MKFIVLFLIALLILSTFAKIKFSKELGISNTRSFIKLLLLPVIFAVIAMGVIIYFM